MKKQKGCLVLGVASDIGKAIVSAAAEDQYEVLLLSGIFFSTSSATAITLRKARRGCPNLRLIAWTS
jgi:hypothetical protein